MITARINPKWLTIAFLFGFSLFVLSACTAPVAGENQVVSPQVTDRPLLTEETTAIEIYPTIETGSGNTSTPITVRLRLSKVPVLGETVELTLIVLSIQDAPGTTADILLPDGAILVDGAVHWTGDLFAGQPQTLSCRIQFVKEGNWTIEGKALAPQSNGDIWGDAAFIYLHISKVESYVGFPTATPGDSMGELLETPKPVEPQP